MKELCRILIFGLLAALFLPASALALVVSGDYNPWNSNPTKCVFPGLEMTPETKIHAIVTYGNFRQPGYDIYEIPLIKVTVNSPDEPVALMLGAYDSAVWHISWTEGTNLKAVLVSGLYAQKIVGLPEDVPVLNSSLVENTACAFFDVRAKDDFQINNASRLLFGRQVDKIHYALTGQALVGRALAADGERLVTAAESASGGFARPEQASGRCARPRGGNEKGLA